MLLLYFVSESWAGRLRYFAKYGGGRCACSICKLFRARFSPLADVYPLIPALSSLSPRFSHFSTHASLFSPSVAPISFELLLPNSHPHFPNLSFPIQDFCAGLHDQLVIPWLPEDTWRVTSGKWINPGRLFGAKPAGFSGANHSASPQFTMAGFGSSESHEEESEEIATPRQIDLHRFSRKSAHKLPAIMASDDEIAGSQRSCASSASPSVVQAAPLLPKQNASQSSPRRPPQSAAPSAPCTPQRSTEGLDQLRAAMQTAPISSQLLASRSNSRIPLDA
eukprot:6186499-Pleurochrysis_carterae.AAC.1